jgi:hypothetical protein
MMEYLLLPALLGAVLSILLCAVRSSRKIPLFWIPVSCALTAGACTLLLLFGFSLFSLGFWSGGKGPSAVLASCMFGLGALGGFVPSLGVVLFYRAKNKQTHHENG